jgi:hypothetical protein
MLLGRGEESDKLVCGRPQVTDAPVGWQRAYVEQNSGGTLKPHVSIIAGWGEEDEQDAAKNHYNPVADRVLSTHVLKRSLMKLRRHNR